ncbi:MAG TPA: acyltransferase [Jatrophihabitantaceae bacterium]
MTAAPEAPRRFDALDGMRALAAFGVIATHAAFETGRATDHGPFAPFLSRLDFGVTVFFLLSGFLLYRPFARHIFGAAARPRPAEFWWRRGLRILPAYWVTIVVTLGLLSTRPASLGDWTSYLLLVQTYDHHNLDPSLSQMWTLAVEIAFYAVLPLLAVGAGRLSCALGPLRGQLAMLAGLGLLTIGWQVIARTVPSIGLPGLLWLPQYVDWFAAGMLLAVLSVVPDAPDGRRAGRLLRVWARDPLTCWVIAGLLFWIATLPLCGPLGLFTPTIGQWVTRHYLYAASAFFLLLPLTLGRGGPIATVLGSRPMRVLGQLSYGVYLWHLPILIAIYHAMGWPLFDGQFVLLYVLTATSSVAVAAVSWFGLERPVLRRFSRPWRGATRTATRTTEAMHSS